MDVLCSWPELRVSALCVAALYTRDRLDTRESRVELWSPTTEAVSVGSCHWLQSALVYSAHFRKSKPVGPPVLASGSIPPLPQSLSLDCTAGVGSYCHRVPRRGGGRTTVTGDIRQWWGRGREAVTDPGCVICPVTSDMIYSVLDAHSKASRRDAAP